VIIGSKMQASRSEAFFQLIYKSRPASALDQESLIEILKDAQKYNQDEGISGFLLYGQDELIQLIEGEEQKVKVLFQKIESDPRHSEITVQYFGYADSRCMPFLGMGLCLMQEVNSYDHQFYFTRAEAKQFNSLIKGPVGEIFGKYLD